MSYYLLTLILMSRIVGPKMTRENYFSLLSMILSNNRTDQILAYRLCISFRGDSNFLYYGSILLKLLYKLGIEGLEERWILHDKIKRIVDRKFKGTTLITKSSWVNWFWKYDYTDSHILIRKQLEKILDQINLNYDKLD